MQKGVITAPINANQKDENNTTENDGEKKENTPLNKEILDILGDRLVVEKIYGEAVAEELALRINQIVTIGLKSDEVKKHVETYATPSNCRLIDPPKINIKFKTKELKDILERDRKMIKNQVKGAAVLSAA